MKQTPFITTIVWAIICLSVFSCKKNETPDAIAQTDVYDKLAQLTLIATNAKNEMLEIGGTQNLSVYEALAVLADKLEKDKSLDDLWVLDSTYLYMQKGGFTQVLSIAEYDNNGICEYRGSQGSKGRLAKFDSESNETIDNNKVLCFIPKMKEFYYNQGNFKSLVVDRLSGSDLDLDVEVLYDKNASIERLRSIDQYGLVLLETHGSPDGFMTGETAYMDSADFSILNDPDLFQDWVSESFGKYVAEYLEDGRARLIQRLSVDKSRPGDWWNEDQNTNNGAKLFELEITARGVRALNIDLSKTVVFGNMCYSGYNAISYRDKSIDPIQPAFLKKNPISYYAYTLKDGQTSSTVTNNFARACLDTLISSLLYDLDSTGTAHLFNGSDKAKDPNLLFGPKRYQKELYFEHYGEKNYHYPFATFTDPRDEEVYRLVEIGDQIWFAENLRYETSGSVAPDNDPGQVEVYGRLYHSHDLMQGQAPVSKNAQKGIRGVCPKGWHIPSHLELVELENYSKLDGERTDFDKYGRAKVGGKEYTAWLIADSSDWASSMDQKYANLLNKSKFSGRPAGLAHSDYENGSIDPDATTLAFGKSLRLASSSYIDVPLSDNSVRKYLIHRKILMNYSQSDILEYEIDGIKGTISYTSCRCLKD